MIAYLFWTPNELIVSITFHMQIRNLEGHDKRVATASWNHWNGHILTSGSQDKSIINHDSTWISSSLSWESKPRSFIFSYSSYE